MWFGGDRRCQPDLIHASDIPFRMAPKGGSGGADRSLFSVTLAGLTSLSETPFSSGGIALTGLFLHVASLASHTGSGFPQRRWIL